MRNPGSYHDYLLGASTVAEVLAKANLTADFAAAQHEFPEVIRFANWLIEDRLRQVTESDGDDDDKWTPTSFAKKIKKANERATQFRLQLTPDDALPDREIDQLLGELEKIIAVVTGHTGEYVFSVPEIGDISLRAAVEHPRAWDHVIDTLVRMADTARMHADFALKAVKIAREISRRIKKR